MSKNSSATYYQYNKERLQKEPVEDIKVFPKKKKKKSDYMVGNDTKIYWSKKSTGIKNFFW